MAIVVNFIKDYAPWVYGVCALVALWYLRVVLMARRERKHAVFTLEREAALNHVYGAWTVAIGLAVTMGLVYLISTVVSEAVRPLVEEIEGTPTPQVVGGQFDITPTLPLPETTPTSTPTARPRPTRRPEPTLAPPPTSNAPAVQAPRCPDPRSVITSPGVNQVVSGQVAIIGTAISDNFAFYKLEYGVGPNPCNDCWSFFAEGDQPVQNGPLGLFPPISLPSGTYSIRVIPVDKTANYPDQPCQTTVVIP